MQRLSAAVWLGQDASQAFEAWWRVGATFFGCRLHLGGLLFLSFSLHIELQGKDTVLSIHDQGAPKVEA